MSKSKITHTTIRNGALFCLHCGKGQTIKTPIGISEMWEMFKDFNADHAKCKKTWTPPEPDMSLSEIERVDWWMQYGERGISSNTMVCVCYSIETKDIMQDFGFCHPLDADDFRRCWLLVKAVPEIKKRFLALSLVSFEWCGIVEGWEALAAMFEAKDSNFHIQLEKILTDAKTQKAES